MWDRFITDLRSAQNILDFLFDQESYEPNILLPRHVMLKIWEEITDAPPHKLSGWSMHHACAIYYKEKITRNSFGYPKRIKSRTWSLWVKGDRVTT